MQQDLLITNQHFQDINPLLCGKHDCNSGHFFGPASREHFLIHYILSGKGHFIINGKKYELSRGWVFLIRPHELHYYQADQHDPWNYTWIGFKGQQAAPLIDRVFQGNNRDVFYTPQLEYLFTSMWEAKDMQHCSEIFLCSKLYEFITRLSIKTVAENVHTSSTLYVTRAKDYFKANYSNPISIDNVAKVLGIDRRYFCRIFKKHTNKTPQEYLIDLRLEKAAQLLTQYDFTPGEAARSTGYPDIFNFSKMFKKKYGISPLNYKKIL